MGDKIYDASTLCHGGSAVPVQSTPITPFSISSLSVPSMAPMSSFPSLPVPGPSGPTGPNGLPLTSLPWAFATAPAAPGPGHGHALSHLVTDAVMLTPVASAPVATVAPVKHTPLTIAPIAPMAPIAPVPVVPSLTFPSTSALPTMSPPSPMSPMSPAVTSFGLSAGPKSPAPVQVAALNFGLGTVQQSDFFSPASRRHFATLGYEVGCKEHFELKGLDLPFRGRTGRRTGPHSRRVRRVQPQQVHSVIWPDAWSLISNPSIRQSNDVRLEAGSSTPTVKSAERVLIWHCRHPHGLFSMFSLALGHAETCEKQGLGLIVDWTSTELLYRGPQGEPNVWSAFFMQPAEMQMTSKAIRHAIRSGQYMETSKHHVVYGHYRGVIQDYGGIPAEQAARGRALCRRNVVLQPRFQEKLEQTMSSIFKSGKRLAVHIRRSDKVIEAAANFELSDGGLLKRIVSQCAAWNMDGVFLCSDDASLKKRLAKSLEQSGLVVSTYDATLPAEASQAVHFDKSLDSYKKAEDVVMEAFLMAKGCHGLLSTYSNVSAAVVYLSGDSFPYTTFWDPVEALVQETDDSRCTHEL